MSKEKMANDYHVPVLLSQSIEALQINNASLVVDATFGAGGHSKSILQKLSAKGHLYAFDQDSDALSNDINDERFSLFHSNYRHIKRFLRLVGVSKVDAILADLGISSHQIDVPERGFSFRYDAPLDMRMNVDQPLHAADVLNNYSEEDLVKVFSDYGEVRNAKTLVREIVKYRSGRNIQSTGELNSILSRVRIGPENKYFAPVYQALRIEVNDEMNALCEFLEQTKDILNPGGRLAVISYHSLEDRLVKNLIKKGNVKGLVDKDEFGNISRPFKAVNKTIIEADAEEQRINTRSRSAKLRIATRNNE